MSAANERNEYGPVFAEYQGTGRLRHSAGGEDPCTFTAVQLRDGHIILLVKIQPTTLRQCFTDNVVERLVGTASDGKYFTASGLSAPTSVQFASGHVASYCEYEYRAKKMALEPGSEEATSRSRFAIVNLTLAHNDLDIDHPVCVARLRRVTGYQEVELRFRRSSGIDATAELDVEAADVKDREEAADDICALLSIARGTKVQWIAREDYTASGARHARHHFSHVTKRYCPLALIDPQRSEDTSSFLATAMQTYVKRRNNWGLSSGLLDAYLDAKSDIDYLQARGVKLAVAMEMLKESFVQASSYQDLLRPADEFNAIIRDLKPAVKSVIVRHNFDEQERGVVYGNLKGLNRVPFEKLVAALCSDLEMNMTDDDRALFVRCRNSLVHTGRFYCETADDRDRVEVPPHTGPVDEYFWLLHLMDRVFLQGRWISGPLR